MLRAREAHAPGPTPARPEARGSPPAPGERHPATGAKLTIPARSANRSPMPRCALLCARLLAIASRWGTGATVSAIFVVTTAASVASAAESKPAPRLTAGGHGSIASATPKKTPAKAAKGGATGPRAGSKTLRNADPVTGASSQVGPRVTTFLGVSIVRSFGHCARPSTSSSRQRPRLLECRGRRSSRRLFLPPKTRLAFMRAVCLRPHRRARPPPPKGATISAGFPSFRCQTFPFVGTRASCATSNFSRTTRAADRS